MLIARVNCTSAVNKCNPMFSNTDLVSVDVLRCDSIPPKAEVSWGLVTYVLW